ncbi:hypothetical protein J6590_024149 [Homalodisca vitripennis]|nr:hypothetical protein J6590_024149 [Homalodisca vitripennis]
MLRVVSGNSRKITVWKTNPWGTPHRSLLGWPAQHCRGNLASPWSEGQAKDRIFITSCAGTTTGTSKAHNCHAYRRSCGSGFVNSREPAKLITSKDTEAMKGVRDVLSVYIKQRIGGASRTERLFITWETMLCWGTILNYARKRQVDRSPL